VFRGFEFGSRREQASNNQHPTFNIKFEDENEDEDEQGNGASCNPALRICHANLPLANRLRVLF
jgi:hypothetical protein